MPPPTQRWMRPSATAKVRIVSARSRSPFGQIVPYAPIEAPRPTGSSAAIRSTAAIFGAPVTDPPGKTAARTRSGRHPGGARPRPARRGARHRPARAAPSAPASAPSPARRRATRSLRSRSTIITCSAASFSDSVSPSTPSGRVPLIGIVQTRAAAAAQEELGRCGDDRPAVADERPRRERPQRRERAGQRGRRRRGTAPTGAGRGSPGTRPRRRSRHERPRPQPRTPDPTTSAPTPPPAKYQSVARPEGARLQGGSAPRPAVADMAPAAARRRLAADPGRKAVAEVDVGDEALGAALEEALSPQGGLDLRERCQLPHGPTLTSRPCCGSPPLSSPSRMRTMLRPRGSTSSRRLSRRGSRHSGSADELPGPVLAGVRLAPFGGRPLGWLLPAAAARTIRPVLARPARRAELCPTAATSSSSWSASARSRAPASAWTRPRPADRFPRDERRAAVRRRRPAADDDQPGRRHGPDGSAHRLHAQRGRADQPPDPEPEPAPPHGHDDPKDARRPAAARSRGRPTRRSRRGRTSCSLTATDATGNRRATGPNALRRAAIPAHPSCACSGSRRRSRGRATRPATPPRCEWPRTRRLHARAVPGARREGSTENRSRAPRSPSSSTSTGRPMRTPRDDQARRSARTGRAGSTTRS